MQGDRESALNRRPASDFEVTVPPSGVHPGRAALAGRTVTLAPLNPLLHSDSLHSAILESLDAEQAWRFMSHVPEGSPEATLAWLKTCAASSDPSFFSLLNPDATEAGGMVSYLNIVPAHGSVELGNIWFRPGWRGTSQATEAIYLMMVHAFDSLLYRRVEWKCDALNDPSRRAALRFGFRFEGLFHNHFVVRGRNRDTAWYSITQEEWPDVKAAFDHWLRAENFNADGSQKTSLSELTRALWSR